MRLAGQEIDNFRWLYTDNESQPIFLCLRHKNNLEPFIYEWHILTTFFRILYKNDENVEHSWLAISKF